MLTVEQASGGGERAPIVRCSEPEPPNQEGVQRTPAGETGAAVGFGEARPIRGRSGFDTVIGPLGRRKPAVTTGIHPGSDGANSIRIRMTFWRLKPLPLLEFARAVGMLGTVQPCGA